MNESMNAHDQIAGVEWLDRRLSRRSFAVAVLAAVGTLAGCQSAQKPAATVTLTKPTPTAVVMQPATRIEPDNASRVRSLAVLNAQQGAVRGVAWASDSRTVASGSYGVVQLWDVRTGSLLATLRGHSNQVQHMAWAPDGSLLASSSRDGTVRLWDTGARKMQSVLRAPQSDPQLAVAWSPDSSRLASGSASGVVLLWDAKRGKQLAAWTLKGSGPFRAGSYPLANWGLAWSPGGRRVAASRYDGIVNVLDARSGRALAVLQSSNQPNDVAWSPDNRVLATSSDDGSVQLWDQAYKHLATLSAHPEGGWAYPLAWSPNGHLLVCARQSAASCSSGTSRRIARWPPCKGRAVLCGPWPGRPMDCSLLRAATMRRFACGAWRSL